LQLRGHRELLAESELQGWLEHSSRYVCLKPGIAHPAACPALALAWARAFAGSEDG
jgi:hypothetical protein